MVVTMVVPTTMTMRNTAAAHRRQGRAGECSRQQPKARRGARAGHNAQRCTSLPGTFTAHARAERHTKKHIRTSNDQAVQGRAKVNVSQLLQGAGHDLLVWRPQAGQANSQRVRAVGATLAARLHLQQLLDGRVDAHVAKQQRVRGREAVGGPCLFPASNKKQTGGHRLSESASHIGVAMND